MSFAPATTTYRGESLEELLQQVREELGSDSVIVRQREGIVGGLGGFFGRKCVEVDAHPAIVRPSVPPRAVVDAYDTGDSAAPAGDGETDAENRLVETLLAQTSPFAEELSHALAREPARPPAPAPPRAPAPARPSFPADLAPRPARRLPERRAAAEVAVRAPADDARTVRSAFDAAGIPATIVDAVLGEVDQVLRTFEPFASYHELARRALTRRIAVSHGWRTKRRTIAVVGLPGSGRTLTAAKLCHAFAGAGRTVSALSLEPARKAIQLAQLTEGGEVGFEVADTVDAAALAKRRLRPSEIVVVDTPALVDPVDGRRLGRTLRLLGAVKPDEIHLLLPVGADFDAARAFVGSLTRHLKPSRLLLTHGDAQTPRGVGVGLSLANRIPISFVAAGDRPAGGLAPAEPDSLARMVLR